VSQSIIWASTKAYTPYAPRSRLLHDPHISPPRVQVKCEMRKINGTSHYIVQCIMQNVDVHKGRGGGFGVGIGVDRGRGAGKRFIFCGRPLWMTSLGVR